MNEEDRDLAEMRQKVVAFSHNYTKKQLAIIVSVLFVENGHQLPSPNIDYWLDVVE